ncbi:MAG: hypothetical protein CM1200mP20_05370 [Pseudomonadota bacterium]|nr:MAG: hypothetical protein CM1200mP20_05370 [Pseudomonadota bacterium]
MPKFLSEDAINAYRTDGFFSPVRVLSEQSAQHCRGELETFEAKHGHVF